MKKILFFVLCLSFLSAAAHARGAYPYKKGDVLLGVALKSASPGLGRDWGEVNVENQTTGIAHDAKLGTASIGAEGQILYFVAPWLALGASAGTEFFSQDLASGLGLDVSTHITNYMAVGRVYVNPSHKYRVYIPFGVGAAVTRMVIDMSPNEHFNYTGFATHLGVGIERGINEYWALGAEMRYNTNKFHRSKVNAHGEYIHVYPQANYLSLLLRAGYRF